MESTTCKQCNRAVYKNHVNRNGLCVLCSPDAATAPPRPATEEEWQDLGRPKDDNDK